MPRCGGARLDFELERSRPIPRTEEPRPDLTIPLRRAKISVYSGDSPDISPVWAG